MEDNKTTNRLKVQFKKQPEAGIFGEWETEDGFKCYTDNRATALRWYKKYLWEKEHRVK